MSEVQSVRSWAERVVALYEDVVREVVETPDAFDDVAVDREPTVEAPGETERVVRPVSW